MERTNIDNNVSVPDLSVKDDKGNAGKENAAHCDASMGFRAKRSGLQPFRNSEAFLRMNYLHQAAHVMTQISHLVKVQHDNSTPIKLGKRARDETREHLEAKTESKRRRLDSHDLLSVGIHELNPIQEKTEIHEEFSHTSVDQRTLSLARSYTTTMRRVGTRSLSRVHPDVKRTACPRCMTPRLPGFTTVVREEERISPPNVGSHCVEEEKDNEKDKTRKVTPFASSRQGPRIEPLETENRALLWTCVTCNYVERNIAGPLRIYANCTVEGGDEIDGKEDQRPDHLASAIHRLTDTGQTLHDQTKVELGTLGKDMEVSPQDDQGTTNQKKIKRRRKDITEDVEKQRRVMAEEYVAAIAQGGRVFGEAGGGGGNAGWGGRRR